MYSTITFPIQPDCPRKKWGVKIGDRNGNESWEWLLISDAFSTLFQSDTSSGKNSNKREMSRRLQPYWLPTPNLEKHEWKSSKSIKMWKRMLSKSCNCYLHFMNKATRFARKKSRRCSWLIVVLGIGQGISAFESNFLTNDPRKGIWTGASLSFLPRSLSRNRENEDGLDFSLGSKLRDRVWQHH